MNTDPDFSVLPYYLSAIVLFFVLRWVLPIAKAWCIRRWRVTAGVVKDTMLVPHTELVQQAWRKSPYSFAAVSQYVAVVNYVFHDRGIDREGRLEQRFANEGAAHKFLGHFHTGQTVSVRHSSFWPHSSALEFDPTILHAAQSLERAANHKAVSIGSTARRALFLFGIALAICAVIALALFLVITITHRT